MGIDIYTDVLKPDIAAPEYVLRCLSYGSVATFHEWEIDGESYFVRPVVHEVGRKNADYTSTWYLNRSVENVICSAFNDEISTSRVWEYSKYTGV